MQCSVCYWVIWKLTSYNFFFLFTFILLIFILYLCDINRKKLGEYEIWEKRNLLRFHLGNRIWYCIWMENFIYAKCRCMSLLIWLYVSRQTHFMGDNLINWIRIWDVEILYKNKTFIILREKCKLSGMIKLCIWLEKKVKWLIWKVLSYFQDPF